MRLILILFLLSPLYLFAQKPAIIETDPNTPSSINNIPFDRPVLLKIPVPGKFVESIQLIELRGKQKRDFENKLPSLKSKDSLTSLLYKYMAEKNYGRLPEIPKGNQFYDYFGVIKNGDKEEFFIRIEALKEFKKDTVVAEKTVTPATKKEPAKPRPIKLYTTNAPATENQPPSTSTQQNNTRQLSLPISIKESISRFYIKPNSRYILLISKESTIDPIIDSTKFKNSIQVAVNDDNRSFKPEDSQKIDILYKNIYSLLKKAKSLPLTPQTNIREQIKFIVNAYTDGRKNYYNRLSKFYSDSTLFVVAEIIHSQDIAKLNHILIGEDLLTKWDAELEAEELKNLKKIEFLSINKNAIEKFKSLVDYFYLINKDSTDVLKTWTDDFYDKLLTNLKLHKKVEELRGEIGALTRENKLSIALETKKIVSSSEIFDFDTRTNFAITPEFGYIFVPNLKQGEITGNNASNEIYPKNYNTPFVGFHINFRYWDKNLPFWSNPNHKLINHFSWMLGYTLSPMKSKVTESFFNNGRNLITGIGFRLGNAVRVVGGVMLYNKLYGSSTVTEIPKTIETQKTIIQTLIEKTGNITSQKETTTTTIERTPIIEKKVDEIFPNRTQLGCSFFFGISLDLSPKLLGIESASDLVTKIIPRIGTKTSTPR